VVVDGVDTAGAIDNVIAAARVKDIGEAISRECVVAGSANYVFNVADCVLGNASDRGDRIVCAIQCEDDGSGPKNV
jgi:hypothetical protein